MQPRSRTRDREFRPARRPWTPAEMQQQARPGSQERQQSSQYLSYWRTDYVIGFARPCEKKCVAFISCLWICPLFRGCSPKAVRSLNLLTTNKATPAASSSSQARSPPSSTAAPGATWKASLSASLVATPPRGLPWALPPGSQSRRPGTLLGPRGPSTVFFLFSVAFQSQQSPLYISELPTVPHVWWAV